MRVLVIAPHPDDEVLGTGATMHRMVQEGHHVTAAIVTKGWAPLFSDEQVEQVRAEARAANDVLGVQSVRFLDLPVTKLHAMPEHELNAVFDDLITETRPEWVFVPFPGDRHEDHRQVFDASQVALRPSAGGCGVKRILCYETVSETHWSAPTAEPTFQPQLFIDVTDHLAGKLAAMREYRSQVRPPPDARSIEAVQALAIWRGSVAGMGAAEAFVVVRDRW